MKDIIWKDVKGFEGYYTVSNTGLIKSAYKSKKILKPKKDKDGYLMVSLYKDNKPHSLRVHRIVALTFIPNPDNLPVVNHIDKVVDNNIPSNLEWVTSYENTMHGYRTSAVVNGLSLLPLDIIASIPDMYSQGKTYKEIIIALGLECEPKQIGHLLSGKRFIETTGLSLDIRRKDSIHITKLSDFEVLDIYHKYFALKHRQKDLVDFYGVSDSQISRIVNGISRKDLYKSYFLNKAS